MKIWYNRVIDPTRQCVDTRSDALRIGRSAASDLVLDAPQIAPEALVVRRSKGQWLLQVREGNAVRVGDRMLHPGESLPFDRNLVVTIFPFTIEFEPPSVIGKTDAERRAELDDQMSELVRAVHRELLERADPDSVQAERKTTPETVLQVERIVENVASDRIGRGKRRELRRHVAGHGARDFLLWSVIEDAGGLPPELNQDRGWKRLHTSVPDREKELEALAAYLFDRLRAGGEVDGAEAQIACIETNFWSVWESSVGDIHRDMVEYLFHRHVKKEIKDVVYGYGPLEDLIGMPTIAEIMVVDRERIFIERRGKIENSGRRFLSDAITLSIIERIVSRVGRRIDKSRPLVDARLSDGSRVNAVIPPLAVEGPCLTIRKFPLRRLSIEDLVRSGALTASAAEFLRASVVCKKNVLVSGGTGTGKTTLLNCLSNFIPDRERIVTIEDTAELQIPKEHVVRLETKDANAENAGAYTIRDLVKNALRMRPDRIVVGECRGAEALDMLQAMNTGHSGSMSTIHANSSAEALVRLEVLVQFAADLPLDSIQRQIAGAVDLVVQLSRLRDGRRVVSQISEIVRHDRESKRIVVHDVFLREDDSLRGSGALPSFMEELLAEGSLSLATFCTA